MLRKKLMMEIVMYDKGGGNTREQWPLGEETFDLRPDEEGAAGRDSIWRQG